VGFADGDADAEGLGNDPVATDELGDGDGLGDAVTLGPVEPLVFEVPVAVPPFALVKNCQFALAVTWPALPPTVPPFVDVVADGQLTVPVKLAFKFALQFVWPIMSRSNVVRATRFAENVPSAANGTTTSLA
jgi:hypothetical protein